MIISLADSDRSSYNWLIVFLLVLSKFLSKSGTSFIAQSSRLQSILREYCISLKYINLKCWLLSSNSYVFQVIEVIQSIWYPLFLSRDFTGIMAHFFAKSLGLMEFFLWHRLIFVVLIRFIGLTLIGSENPQSWRKSLKPLVSFSRLNLLQTNAIISIFCLGSN